VRSFGGYRHLPVARIVHIDAKDGRKSSGKPSWSEIGREDIDWAGQIQALASDGYRGAISLETHWTGPHGDKFEASRICGKALAELVGNRVR
jgi:L-ribulose-5-phosphate 3-epimerase